MRGSPNPSLFIHPLAQPTPEQVEVDGKTEAVVDLYTACSYWLYQACCGNDKAIALTIALIEEANPALDAQSLLDRCQQEDVAAIRQVLALLTTQLVAKFDAAFEAPGRS